MSIRQCYNSFITNGKYITRRTRARAHTQTHNTHHRNPTSVNDENSLICNKLYKQNYCFIIHSFTWQTACI